MNRIVCAVFASPSVRPRIKYGAGSELVEGSEGRGNLLPFVILRESGESSRTPIWIPFFNGMVKVKEAKLCCC